MRNSVRILVGVALVGSALLGGRVATAADLVLYLPFDEGQGAVAEDASGRDHHATLEGKAAWGDGKYGGGIELVPGSFLVVEDSPDFDLTTAMTLMGWVRIPADTGDHQSLIEKAPGWEPGEYNLLPDYNNQVLLQMHDLPDNCNDEILGGNVIDGTWHHVAGVWDGTEITIYVDGEVVRQAECAGEIQANDKPLYIGSRGGNRRWLVGNIDEIKIFNGPLSKKEVQQAMEQGTGLAVQPNGKAAELWGRIKATALQPAP